MFKRKIKTKVASVLLTLAMFVWQLPQMSVTAFAANSDGGITITATYCAGRVFTACNGSVSTSFKRSLPEYSCGNSNCSVGHLSEHNWSCSKCGMSGTFNQCTGCGLGSLAYQSIHGTTSSCPHNSSKSHYTDSSYDYDGKSKTFIVYPITLVTSNGITATISVYGATATDAAMSGKKVSLNIKGVPSNAEYVFDVNGESTKYDSTVTAQSFTMPAKATTVTISLATVAPTTTANVTTLNKTYLDADFDVASMFSTNSDGTKSYSSSNTNVATVSGSTVKIVGAGSTTITMNTAATGGYYASSASFSLVVAKPTPTLSGISAKDLTYGQTLASSTISGTAKVGTKTIAGTWSWTNSAIAPVAGTASYDIKFTPNDSNINAATGKCSIKTNSSDNYSVTVNPSAITYGSKLSASAFNETSTVLGTIKWDNPNATPSAGEYSAAWTFTPSSSNYAVKHGTAIVTVNKAPLVITVSSIRTLTYGESLDAATVTGTAKFNNTNVDGKFVWVNGSSTKPSVSDSGVTTYVLQFVPTNANYQVMTLSRTVVVVKATPISNPAAVTLVSTPITYGESLANSIISATSTLTVAGVFEWVDSSITPSVAESGHAYAVKFIPTDTVNYDVVSGLTCAVTVNKASPDMSIVSVLASGIVYGQPLADSVLTGDVPVSGHYEWANDTIKPSVLDSNTTGYDVIFVPDDESNFNRATIKVKLEVIKALPVISDPMKLSVAASGIIYGDTLANSTLSGDTPVAGTYEWVDPSIMPAVADSDTTLYDVIFVPTDSINYESVAGLTCTVNVAKATPNVTGDMQVTISATAITYGDCLGDSTLSGDMPVDGHYEWADVTIQPSVPDSNLTEYDVIFVPDDQDNYNVTTGLKCKLTVNRAVPDITDRIKVTVHGSDITYGDCLGDSILSGDTPVDGHYEWADATIQPSVSDSESTEYSVVFVPDDTINYVNAFFGITIKVNPLTPTVTVDMEHSITATGIIYEQTLGDSILSGDTPIAGSYRWVDEDFHPSVSDSNNTLFGVIFVPDDSINYTSVSGLHATLEVVKATPVITPPIQATLVASTISYGQSLKDSVVSGDVPLSGHYEWFVPTITPTVSDSNSTEYVLIFVPNDTANYNTATTVLKLAVDRAAPNFSAGMVSASDISFGNTLADSVLTTQLPTLNDTEITGSFAWADSSISPDAGEWSYDVIFTPDDRVNFTTSVISVPIKVHKKALDIPNEIKVTVSASQITYGETLASSIITGDVIMEGHYEWVDSSVIPSVSDSEATPYDVVFKPNDSNYADFVFAITVKVVKAIPVIDEGILDSISASPIWYGQKLSESFISGTTPAAGTYVWENGDIIPEVDGDNRFMVVFIPTDSVNYEPVEVGKVPVTVMKIDPELTEQDYLSVVPSWIMYGQSLSDSVIHNASSKPGNIVWADGTIKPTVADSQRTEYDAIFTPDDVKNYNVVTLKLKITVYPSIPALPNNIEDKLNTSPIYVGQTLADSSISCTDTSILPGKFVWNDPNIKPSLSDSDVTWYNIMFVPEDSVNYESAPLIGKVHVKKRNISSGGSLSGSSSGSYNDIKDILAVKAGQSVEYDFSNVVHLENWNVAGNAVSDPKGIIDGYVVVRNNVAYFKIRSDATANTADLSFTVSSSMYDDYTFTLTVIVSKCEHGGGTHIRGKVNATWDESGYTGDLVCDECGATIRYGEVIAALKTKCKHTDGTHLVGYTEATCQHSGFTGNKVCDCCDVVVEQGSVIAQKEHTLKIVNEVEATCLKQGYTGDTMCTECGALLYTGKVISKSAHVEGEGVIVSQATSISTGEIDYFCVVCGKLLRTEIIPIDTDDTVEHVHKFGSKWHYNDNYHWHECKSDGAVSDKAEHDWDDGVYLTATCVSAGTVEYTCVICGAIDIREEAGGHRLSDWQFDDGAHYRVCLVCGKHFEEHTHTFGKWESSTVYSSGGSGEYGHHCTMCGYTVYEYFDEDPNDETLPGDGNDDIDKLLPEDSKVTNDSEDGSDDGDNPYTGDSADIPMKMAVSAVLAGICGILSWRHRKKSS